VIASSVPGAPPAWNSYVTVESADDIAARAAELGATVAMPPFDVFDSGRMTVIADPTGAVFGITVNEVAMGPDDAIYRELHVAGDAVGGAMAIGDDWPAEIPSHWMTYFAVDDTDATAAKAKALGGNVNAEPFEIPVGRMAVLSDPGGAHFSVLNPKPPE